MNHIERPSSQGSTATAWDDFDAYLFDIDGTLLHCADAVHYFAFCDALTMLAGRPLNLEGVVAHGNTDVGILRDALTLAGISDAQWRPQLEKATSRMCRFVDEKKSSLSATALPGAAPLLDYLRSRGAVLGVATGNLAGIGRLKLQHCGLLDRFDFGGYSDNFEYRHEVFRAALDQAKTLTREDSAVCVVGDTPEDIRAARRNKLHVIAVATGVYSFESLQAERPDWCLRSLEELMPTPAPMNVASS